MSDFEKTESNDFGNILFNAEIIEKNAAAVIKGYVKGSDVDIFNISSFYKCKLDIKTSSAGFNIVDTKGNVQSYKKGRSHIIDVDRDDLFIQVANSGQVSGKYVLRIAIKEDYSIIEDVIDDEMPDVNTPDEEVSNPPIVDNPNENPEELTPEVIEVVPIRTIIVNGVENIGLTSNLKPGDEVIFKGVYKKGTYAFGFLGLHGTVDHPIVIKGNTLDDAIFDGNGASLGISDCSHLVFENIKLINTLATEGSGLSISLSRNITFNNIDSSGHVWGAKGMQDLHDIIFDNCSFHDNAVEHGAYFGAREQPCSNITFNNCKFFKNGRHGIQYNGRITGLIIKGCEIYNNNLGGISLINGVSDSVIENNIIRDNNKQGVIFYTYDESQHNIYAYSQNNNVVRENIIVIPEKSYNGKYNPKDYPAILFNNSSALFVEMFHNEIYNNKISTYGLDFFSFSDEAYKTNNNIHNNELISY